MISRGNRNPLYVDDTRRSSQISGSQQLDNAVRDSAEAVMLADSVPDTGGLYFVPAFVGTAAPHYDSFARGTMFGITDETNRGHIARAALEAMAYQTRDAIESVSAHSGNSIDVIRADGGVARSDFLLQFQSDILGIPVERPDILDAAAMGAAYMAGLYVGFWDSVDEISQLWRCQRRFEPQLTTGRRDALYEGWSEAVNRAAGWREHKM